MVDKSNLIVFKDITIKNFMSVKDEVTFSFSDFYGLNFVVGNNRDIEDSKNGTGKSTIFCSAMLYALYGKTQSPVKKVHLINRAAVKGAEIDITFDIGEDEYLIRNGIKPTYLLLYKNNEDISKHSIGETRRFIEEEILGASFEMFKHTVILSTSTQKSIFELSSSQKREFIEDIFDLSFLGEMFQKNRKDLNSLKKAASGLKIEFDGIKSSLQSYKAKHDSFTSDQDFEIRKHTKEINTITKLLKDSRDIISEIDITEATEKLDKIEANVTKVRDVINTTTLTRNNTKHEIASYKKDIAHVTGIFDRYKVILEKVGSCCKSIVDSEFDVSDNEARIISLNEDITRKTSDIDRYTATIDKLNTILEKLTSDKAKLNSNIATFQNTTSRINTLEASLELHTKAMAKSSDSESPFKDLITESTAKIGNVKEQIITTSGDMRYGTYIDHVLSPQGIKAWIISKMITNLNSLVSSYLSELGADYSVVFDPNLECEFLTTSGPCDYQNFSSGEKKRIDHAFMFAVRTVLQSQGILKTSFMVADEVLDSAVDDICVEALLKIFKRITKGGQSVFIVSHRSTISTAETFDNTIEVIKENGKTTINEASIPNGS